MNAHLPRPAADTAATTPAHADAPTTAAGPAERPPGRRRALWAALVLGLGVAGATAYYFAGGAGDGRPATADGGGRKGERGNRPQPVRTAPVQAEDIDVALTGIGTVTPLATVTVKARVDGQLQRVLFREGQTVHAGELLAEIDPRPFQVAVMQAEGQLARDQALLANAKIDLERYRTLFAQDSIARQQLDTQEALVRQYEGALLADRGAIENARLQLSFTRITAPVGGRLGLRQVDPGNLIRSTDANGVVVITQMQPMTVIFALPEANLPALQQRLAAGGTLAVDAYDREGKSKLAAGRLLTVDNQIDPATGTVKLKAQFANDDGGLFPNQFVNVRLKLDTLHGATVAPAAAVQRGAQGTFAYRVQEDGTVSLRPVKLGPQQGEKVAVESGLAVGDVVVVDGTDKLREGAKVEPIAPDSGAGPSGRPRREGGRGGKERRDGGAQEGGHKEGPRAPVTGNAS